MCVQTGEEGPGWNKGQTRARAIKQTAAAQSGHCRNWKQRVDPCFWVGGMSALERQTSIKVGAQKIPNEHKKTPNKSPFCSQNELFTLRQIWTTNGCEMPIFIKLKKPNEEGQWLRNSQPVSHKPSETPNVVKVFFVWILQWRFSLLWSNWWSGWTHPLTVHTFCFAQLWAKKQAETNVNWNDSKWSECRDRKCRRL